MKNILYLVVTSILAISCAEKKPSFQAPLIANIGAYSVNVTTPSEDARRFFNQGVIMANGFNHFEAERSFREAVRLDSGFAMGYWGIAYVLGPNYNSTSNLGAVQDIRNAVRKATALQDALTPWEKALVHAIEVKYPMDTTATNAEAFMVEMKKAYEQFPDNSFVATLYAESVMNLHPWDFYEGKGGAPRAWTGEVVSLIERVIAVDSLNPLAHHIYLHAVEASADVEKALPSAEKLKTLVPAAGHLVHMPSHIYINTGDYHEGSIANEKAVVADSIYIAECKAQGYYPQMYYTHNYHFLAATAALEGRGARAIEAAMKTASIVDPKFMREPGYETVQHYLTIPYHLLVKFAQWEKILASPEPLEADLLYPKAIWHYARGMAYVNQSKLAEANAELTNVRKLAADPALENLMIWGINRVTEVLHIASNVLEAEIRMREGKNEAAVALLKEAIGIEDHLNYNEPPDWFFSVRQVLGHHLLALHDFSGAEKIYRDDLRLWPKNGFALNGLAESLDGQDRAEEASTVRQQFATAWTYADVTLKGSMIDPATRKDLTLRVDENSPNELIAMAGPVCGSR